MKGANLLLWRVAKDTLKRKYDPAKIKERVESALYSMGLWLLLLFLFFLLPALVVFVFGPSEIFNRALQFIRGFNDYSPGTEIERLVVEHPLEALVFLLLLYIATGFLLSVFLAWRRHLYEATHSSSEFRQFLQIELKFFEKSLFVRKSGEFVPMAPIPLKQIEVIPPEGGFAHEVLPTGGRLRSFIRHPMIESVPIRHWLLRRDTVRWPDRIGFAASTIDKTFSTITVTTCRYREDLDTAYSMGYAYYLWFNRKNSFLLRWLGKPAYLSRFEGKARKYVEDNSIIGREGLPDFLNHIFAGEEKIRTQLGVQALVIFNDYSDGGSKEKPIWKVLLQKRSDDVASSPNHFQFVPSGGFESHQSYDGGEFDSFTRALLQHECVLERGLLREFAEEIIGVSEFMDNESLDPDDIYREPGIKFLRDLKKGNFEESSAIQLGRAGLFPLGVSLSLIGFKAEISYLLLIDHPDYFVRHRLRRSEGEAHMIFTWELSALGKLVTSKEHPIVDSSIAMLRLFLDEKHANYRKLLDFQPDDDLLKVVGLR